MPQGISRSQSEHFKTEGHFKNPPRGFISLRTLRGGVRFGYPKIIQSEKRRREFCAEISVLPTESCTKVQRRRKTEIANEIIIEIKRSFPTLNNLPSTKKRARHSYTSPVNLFHLRLCQKSLDEKNYSTMTALTPLAVILLLR